MRPTALDFILQQGSIGAKFTPEEEYAQCAEIYARKIVLYEAINAYNPAIIDQHFTEFRKLEETKDNSSSDQDKNPENRWRFLEQIASMYLEEASPQEILKHEPGSKKYKRLQSEREHVSTLYSRWREAKDAFIAKNIGLVVSKAKRRIHLPLEERIQEGFFYGLARAIDSYDHTLGLKFSTYAGPWIEQAITRAITQHGSTIRKPVHTYEALNKIAQASRKLMAKTGEASPEQIAQETGLKPERVIELLQVHEPVSLDKPVYNAEDGGNPLHDYISDPHADTQGEKLDQERLKKEINEALADLPDRQRLILKRRFGLDAKGEEDTLREIGEECYLSRERIRQLQRIALAKLKNNPRLRRWFEDSRD